MTVKRNILPISLTKLAAQYEVDRETFKGMIQLYPLLLAEVDFFKKAKKRKLPPKVVAMIYDTLGYPEC